MIRNIIFDLGGVIIDLDPAATAKAFIQLGLKDWDAQYSQAEQSGLFDAFDKGTISDAEFRNGLRPLLPSAVTDNQIDDAWNAMLLNIPPERIQLLENIAKSYRIFLLSNTNVIHIHAFSASIQKQFGFGNFNHIFEKVYYSCDTGMRKPDAEIFGFVLKENDLSTAETLFIDDSKQHVIGALKVGLAAKWLDLKKGEDLISWWNSADRAELFSASPGTAQ